VVRIWDPETGEQLATRWGGAFMSAAWSYDGTHIAAVAEDGDVHVWDVERAMDPVDAIVRLVAERSPFRLAGTRLERVAGR
jgi:WD40 repeat protein